MLFTACHRVCHSTGSRRSGHVTRTRANAINFSTRAQLMARQQMAAVTRLTEARGGPHLEVVVLVDGAASVRGHVRHGGQVHVLTGEEEEVHAAALRHALLGQLLVHTFLRLEQSLQQQQNKSSLQ